MLAIPEPSIIDIAKMISIQSHANGPVDYYGFQAIVTILGEDEEYTTLKVGNPDVTECTVILENSHNLIDQNIVSILKFGRANQGKRILVHCRDGIRGRSRSSTIALGLFADRFGEGREFEAIEALNSVDRKTNCDLSLLAGIDRLLKRDGKLLRSWNEFLQCEAHDYLYRYADEDCDDDF